MTHPFPKAVPNTVTVEGLDKAANMGEDSGMDSDKNMRMAIGVEWGCRGDLVSGCNTSMDLDLGPDTASGLDWNSNSGLLHRLRLRYRHGHWYGSRYGYEHGWDHGL